MMLGVRGGARYMLVTFVIVWIGMIAWLLAMAIGSHAHFIATWNAKSGASYGGILAQANHLGFSAAGPIAISATLFGMIYSFQVYTGFQWTGYFAREIRNVRRTATTSILSRLLFAAIGYVLGVPLAF